jgi:hypothetical protein
VSDELERLLARIDALGGDEAYPVVPLDLFFEGNGDEASIGPNLDPHPGIPAFRRVLEDIRSRPEVADVVLQVSEVMSDDEWPFVDAAYVVTTAPAQEVHDWAGELEPDPPDPDAGWIYGNPPPGAPPVPDGHSVIALRWD